MLENTKYYFEDGALYEERTNRTKLCLQSQAIRIMRDSATYVVPSLFDNINLAVSNSGTHLVQEVKEIKLNTFWDAYSGPVFGEADQWPALKASFWNSNGSIKKEVIWSPPAYMKLWYISSYTTNKRLEHTYLVSSIDQDIYRPPLPNVYSSGTICMGNHFDHSELQGSSIIDQHKSSFEDFESTSWNNDLDDGQCRYILCNEDSLIHPEKQKYTDLLEIISSSKLTFMKELL